MGISSTQGVDGSMTGLVNVEQIFIGILTTFRFGKEMMNLYVTFE